MINVYGTCDKHFMMFVSQIIMLYTLNFTVLYVNYISAILEEKKKAVITRIFTDTVTFFSFINLNPVIFDSFFFLYEENSSQNEGR